MGHARLRQDMLRTVYRAVEADPQKSTTIHALKEELKLESVGEAAKIARQLEGSGLVVVSAQNAQGGGNVAITIKGIEECEHLDRPVYNRWAADHPFLWPIVVALTAVAAGKVIDLAIAKPPQAPIVHNHNYIQIPERKDSP